MQNEVNHKEKNKYCITSLICEIQKNGKDELTAKQKQRHTNIENIIWILRGEMKSGMNWDIEIDMYDIQTLLMCCAVHLVISDSLQPRDCSPPGSSVHGDYPGMNCGVGCHALLQGIFPTQGSNQVSCIAGGFFTASAIRLRSPTLLILSIKQILPEESRRHGA